MGTPFERGTSIAVIGLVVVMMLPSAGSATVASKREG